MAMLNRYVTVDFSERRGSIKPVHGMNGGPIFGDDMRICLTEAYREMKIPAVHVAGHGTERFIDVHSVFPDMSLDERMEMSYNFAPTDAYFSEIQNTGAEIFLRLGESPDPYEVGRYTRSPEDLEKWASICIHIIRHYNEGWAGGFKLKIRYVEIWSRADERQGFRGEKVEYYELYRTVATRLKERFPRLKVGGYSAGGFRSLNHFDAVPEEKGYVSFLEGFLSYISAKQHKAPLDFLSWRCIADAPEEVSLHASYARGYLNQYGFKRAESIISEFDLAERAEPSFCRREYPAELASALIIAEKSTADAVFYRNSDPRSPDNSLFCLEDNRQLRPYAAMTVYSAFGRLWALRAKPSVSEDYRREIYTIASTDGKEGEIMLVTRGFSGMVDLNIRGSVFTSYSITGLIGGGERGAGVSTTVENQPLTSGKITLRTGKCEVYLISLG